MQLLLPYCNFKFVLSFYFMTIVIHRKMLNVVFRKDEEDYLHCLCKKWSSVTKNQGVEEHPTYNRTMEG
jgi:hypothetical protein